MQEKQGSTLIDCLALVPDPRVPRARTHELVDILVIAVCAVVCGANSFTQMEEFARAKRSWLQERLGITGKVPSHDTFRRVLGLINPRAFEECFTTWAEAVRRSLQPCVSPEEFLKGDQTDPVRPGIQLDGKVLRRSFLTGTKWDMVHLVSAWANDFQLCLAQLKVPDKSNEITALPTILEMLDIRGCIVTIDAMGCQKEIAAKIIEEGGDYILSLKGNQGNLEEQVMLFFEGEMKNQRFEQTLRCFTTIEKDHGRIERRTFYLADEQSMEEDFSWLDPKKQWRGLRGVGRVESERTIQNKTTKEVRHFLCSISGNVEEFARHTRQHWGIENSQHWVLDVALREDECRVRVGHGAENFALLRKIAINMLKGEKTAKVGVEGKRLRCGWDNRYLEQVLVQRHFQT